MIVTVCMKGISYPGCAQNKRNKYGCLKCKSASHRVIDNGDPVKCYYISYRGRGR